MKRIYLCLLLVVIAASITLQSCVVKRTYTTSASYMQHGDTTTNITIKTVETVHGEKQNPIY